MYAPERKTAGQSGQRWTRDRPFLPPPVPHSVGVPCEAAWGWRFGRPRDGTTQGLRRGRATLSRSGDVPTGRGTPCPTAPATRAARHQDGRRGVAGRGARVDRPGRVDAAPGAQGGGGAAPARAGVQHGRRLRRALPGRAGLRPNTVTATGAPGLADPAVLRRDAAARRHARRTSSRGARRWTPRRSRPTPRRTGCCARLLQAAEEEELIDRAPPKIRGASTAPVKRVAVPATFDELAVIIDNDARAAASCSSCSPRSSACGRASCSSCAGPTSTASPAGSTSPGRSTRTPSAGARGACPSCGRPISAPKTASGVRTVHVPPPFLPMLQRHLLEHTAAGPSGLLFPGDRTDHMSVRYLMDRYRPAREAAGRPDLTIHHLRHTALTLAGQHGATAAELQARAGHASQAAMAIYQHATLTATSAWPRRSGLRTRLGGRAERRSCEAAVRSPSPRGLAQCE